MLKLGYAKKIHSSWVQPPSGGCVLKPQRLVERLSILCKQPPSGGCVLKLLPPVLDGELWVAAAFGRLCVETILELLKA